MITIILEQNHFNQYDPDISYSWECVLLGWLGEFAGHVWRKGERRRGEKGENDIEGDETMRKPNLHLLHNINIIFF